MYHSVLTFYEMIATLSEEVDVVWRRKWTTMTWLYALMRYSTVALSILSFPPAEDIKVWHLMNICHAINILANTCFASEVLSIYSQY